VATISTEAMIDSADTMGRLEQSGTIGDISSMNGFAETQKSNNGRQLMTKGLISGVSG